MCYVRYSFDIVVFPFHLLRLLSDLVSTVESNLSQLMASHFYHLFASDTDYTVFSTILYSYVDFGWEITDNSYIICVAQRMPM